MKRFDLITAATLTCLIAGLAITASFEAKAMREQPEIPTINLELKTADAGSEENEETTYFNVPLSEEIQEHIFKECEAKDVSVAMVIAIVERESQFDAAALGDSGKSKGLMQIQERWHRERMENLGCTDLMDPLQNITVGVDYLAELQQKNPDTTWILMAYNGGLGYANKNSKLGKVSEYAASILERTKEFERGEANGF